PAGEAWPWETIRSMRILASSSKVVKSSSGNCGGRSAKRLKKTVMASPSQTTCHFGDLLYDWFHYLHQAFQRPSRRRAPRPCQVRRSMDDSHHWTEKESRERTPTTLAGLSP